MKIGILAGTFDPVHAGHLAFARQVVNQFSVDKVIFMPERHPRSKTAITPFSKRLAMLKLALAGNDDFEVYDTREKFFTLAGTMLKLERKFRDAHFVIMMGSDAGRRLNDWQGINLLKPHVTFMVALRNGDTEMSVRNALSVPTIKPRVNYCYSPNPVMSASQIRTGQSKTGIKNVDHYIAEHRLYR